MLKKSDLKVIRGGVPDTTSERKFVNAYTTDTRLMGVIVVYIHWKHDKSLHQFFYIETSEEGIEAYKSVKGDDFDEIEYIQQSMLGGLGAKKVPLSKEEAFFLIQKAAFVTKESGLYLPDENEEYEFILEERVELSEKAEKVLFNKICGNISNSRQLVNYFLMRYFAKDFYPVDMLSSEIIDYDLLSTSGSATLCLNKIDIGKEVDGIISYLNESVIEDEKGYRIVLSEVKEDKGRINSLEIISEFPISTAEAAMKLARPEFVSVYEIVGRIDNVEEYLDVTYLGAQQNLTDGGKLYVSFSSNNNHVNCDVYRLNDDVEEIVYLTIEDQLIIGAYSLAGIRVLEKKMHDSDIGKQLIDIGKYEFKEPILYDYTLGFGNDFIGYVEEIIGLDDEDGGDDGDDE